MTQETILAHPLGGLQELTGHHIGHVPGFHATGVHAGLKRHRADVGLLRSDRLATVAGVFTQSKAAASCVRVTRKVTQAGHAHGVVVNSGNANAATGSQGEIDSLEMQALAAKAAGDAPGHWMVASTGVIGKPLPMGRVSAGIAAAGKSLGQGPPDASFSEAILTTDTVTKEVVLKAQTPNGAFHVGVVAKGSGMIAPNMATMLAFVATDLEAKPGALQKALRASADVSYNMVTVDHDTSTNDMALILANGASGLRLGQDVPMATFQAALDEANTRMARAIARDGEGATKLIRVEVGGAKTLAQARMAAKAVAGSPLVKAAVHGADPNWGRVLAAVGASGASMDIHTMTIHLGDVAKQWLVFEAGTAAPFDADAASNALKAEEVVIRVGLGPGAHKATAYGCDLTHGYVDINALYTT